MRPNFCPSLVHWKPLMPQSCAARSKQASRILLIAIGLVLLPALAFASPPDPSWIVGIYDGADGDDIVALFDEFAGVEAKSLPPVLRLRGSFGQLLVSRLEIDSGFPSGLYSRGPPLPSAFISTTSTYAFHPVPDSTATALVREASLEKPHSSCSNTASILVAEISHRS